MNALRAYLGRSAVAVIAVFAALLAISVRVSADGLTYYTETTAIVGAYDWAAGSCGPVGAAATASPSSTASCTGPAGSASVSVDLVTGTAFSSTSISNPYGEGGSADTQGFMGVEGSITGTASSGALTWADSGIVSSGGGVVSLFVEDGVGDTLGYACWNPSGVGGCSSAPGISTTVPVTNGEQIWLSMEIECISGIAQGQDTALPCNITDPLSLQLSPGLQFNSSFPDFLSQSTPPPAPTPEPPSLLLLGSGLLAASFFFRRGKLGVPNI